MASHDAHSSSIANLVGVNYRVGKKIGEGSFGVIFEGTDLLNNQMVAIKFEPRKSDAPQLRDECLSYRILAGCTGVPQIYHFGLEGLHNILVMDLLGPSLEDLFDMCGRKFSVKTVCMTALQMISRVQTIHEKNLIHRGIKPDNFLIGRPGTKYANLVHIIDFGTAKHYRDPETKQHVPYGERKGLGGTANYMSINTHLGREQSRRDDLEALGYVLFYFLRGSLPWQGVEATTNKQKYEKIGEKKQIMRIGELCDSFPGEFGAYLAYVRKLSFEETPDYEFLRALFSGVLKNLDEVDDSRYDWDELNGGRGWESQLTSSSSAQGTPDRHRDDRGRRASAQPTASGVVPPSPALVRHSLKKRKLPAAFVPDNATPNSGGAQVGVSPASPAPRASMQQHAVATDDVVVRPVLRHFSGDAAHERTPKEVLEQLLSELSEFDLTDKIQEGRQWCAGGGYSDVFLGFDSHGTRVAIKRLRFFMQGEHIFNKRATRELRIWSGLRHPNVLPLKGFVIETVEKPSRLVPSLVTDWMENGSLAQYIRSSADVDNLQMIEGILNGLCYLHSMGVVHGDIKAANVLISPDGCPLLMDFGLSHLLLSTSTLETATDATRGSIRWMAPELLGTTKVAEAGDDDKIHTKQSDIWAFGMTALELLTKQVPYSNIRVDPGIIRAMLEKTIPSNPEGLDDWKVIDKKLWGFCKMCWVFNPVERPDMNQLSDELKRIREESKDNLKVVVQAF